MLFLFDQYFQAVRFSLYQLFVLDYFLKQRHQHLCRQFESVYQKMQRHYFLVFVVLCFPIHAQLSLDPTG